MSEPLDTTAEVEFVPARALLRSKPLWIAPAVLAGVLIILISLIYIGSVVNPSGHLRGLPVEIVNEDTGSGNTNLGQQVVAGLQGSSTVTARLKLRTTTRADADHRMATAHAYAAIVIPADFTASLLSLYSQSDAAGGLATITIFTNQRNGSVGTSLATGVAQPALAAVSRSLAAKLNASAATAGSPLVESLRANPITVTTTIYRPLPGHSALGLSAFYIALLTLMCGFLGGTIANSSVDSGLGYAPSEVGPWWRLRSPVAMTRRGTLLAKWVVVTVLSPVLTGLTLIISIGLLHMYAPNVLLLWLFTSFAAIVVALGTLVLFAAFGSLGQLLAMIVFLYLSLASSGGTIPIEALPGFLRFMAEVEPLRQILDGVRSIMYYDAIGDAGLSRGLILTAIGLVFWVAAGLIVTSFYDRRGLHRISPELLAFVNRSAAEYAARNRDKDAETT